MPKRVIETTLLMQPIAHFSHAARVGNLIYVGATAGTDAARKLAGISPGLVDTSAQIERTFDNLETVLRILGASIKNIVRLKTYLADMRDLSQYERAYQNRFAYAVPSHAVTGSWDFPLPQAAVELDAVAIVDEPIARVPTGGVQVGPRFYCTALPLREDGTVVLGGIELQASVALRTLSSMLAASGLTVSDVVYIHVSLADLRDLGAFEDVYRKHFVTPLPARTLVEAPLHETNMRVQLECIAYAGGGKAIGDSSNAYCASDAMTAGDEVFVSAQCAETNDLFLHDDAEKQTRSAWRRIAALLHEVGMTTEHVVKTSNVLTDWRDYRSFNAGYGANVTVPFPPRTTVVGGIRDRGARVQIEALAHRHADQATILDVKASSS